jgi:hypothetical protein
MLHVIWEMCLKIPILLFILVRNMLAREKVLWKKWRLLLQDCKQYDCDDNFLFLFNSIFNQEAEEDFGTGKFAKYQKSLWDLIEHSESSKAAEVTMLFIMT